MTLRRSVPVVFAGLLVTLTAAQPPDRAALEKRLADLLRERVDELRKEVAALTEEFKDVRGTLESLLDAQWHLGRAELELTDDPKHREAVHERLIHALREIETINKARAGTGRIPLKMYQESVAARARAECGLILEQMQTAGADKAKLTARLEELRRERLTALREAATSRMNMMIAGRGTLFILLDVYRDLAQVELEMAADPRQRQQAQERLLKAMQELEQLYQQRFDANRAPIQDLLQSRAARLEAEIALGGDRVPQLRQELVTVRRQEVEERAKDFRDGRGVLDILLAAQAGLARAELALSEDPRRQVAVQERAVKALRELEDINRGRFESNRIPAQDLAETKAARLTAEVELVRLQLKALPR
jgi:hypothetical protein